MNRYKSPPAFIAMFNLIIICSAFSLLAQTVPLPEPHELLTPENGTTAGESQELVFFWTSATKLSGRQVIYEFMLVPVKPGQQPQQAITVNPPLQTLKMRRTFFQYPMSQHPLKPGLTYAWRVRAVDEQNRAIAQNEGYSATFTFTLADDLPQLPQYDPRITTGPIKMTGMRYKAPLINTGPIKMTGMRPGDLHINTGLIKMTGMRPGDLHINTGLIKMTGLRYRPIHIDTGPIKMSGMRFKPHQITTGPIKMSGMRGWENQALEWIGPQIEAVHTTFMDFINMAKAYQQEAAVEKLNTVVTLVDELKQQALTTKQTELQQQIELVSGHLGELQTLYPKTMASQEAVVAGSSQTDEQKQQMAAVKSKSQQINTILNQMQNQLPEMIKAP
ncbi:hypothetical protein HQ585_12290 [candidate division KSB1 bacterium]|nr:hypothetical protein [candidate division KSB1 bacterium]